MNFIDEAYLEIKAGDGGSGASSFRREKNIRADELSKLCKNKAKSEK